MHPAFIKAELQVKGCGPKQLAKRLGVTDSAVSHVLKGRICSIRIASEMSRITGIPVSRLFPGKYDRKKKA